MGAARLVYNGNTYSIDADALPDLLARGVVVDPASDGSFELSREHAFEELEPLTTPLARNDAPPPTRLGRLRVRAFSLLAGLEQNAMPPTTNPVVPRPTDRRGL
jgi:hypothetical protein